MHIFLVLNTNAAVLEFYFRFQFWPSVLFPLAYQISLKLEYTLWSYNVISVSQEVLTVSQIYFLLLICLHH